MVLLNSQSNNYLRKVIKNGPFLSTREVCFFLWDILIYKAHLLEKKIELGLLRTKFLLGINLSWKSDHVLVIKASSGRVWIFDCLIQPIKRLQTEIL